MRSVYPDTVPLGLRGLTIQLELQNRPVDPGKETVHRVCVYTENESIRWPNANLNSARKKLLVFLYSFWKIKCMK